MGGITTDIEVALWLRLQRPEVVERFAHACDELAHEEDGVTGLEVFAGTARAVLRGDDPVRALRRSAELVPDFYAESGDNETRTDDEPL